MLAALKKSMLAASGASSEGCTADSACSPEVGAALLHLDTEWCKKFNKLEEEAV